MMYHDRNYFIALKDIPTNLQIDHINGNKIDNIKNLRRQTNTKIETGGLCMMDDGDDMQYIYGISIKLLITIFFRKKKTCKLIKD